MRVMGVETEYSVWCPNIDPDIALEQQRLASIRIAGGNHLPEEIERVRRFLSNGAKLYEDVGNHPEYCTPEVYGAFGTIIAEASGIEVMGQILDNIRHDKSWAPIKQLSLLRRVSDDKESWGYHLNFQASRELQVNPVALSPLILQMIGGTSLFGAGHLKDSGAFWTSQRAPHLQQYVNEFTTAWRPLINSRDEPHADAAKWRRLHVIGNDALHSPWTSWLRLGTYDLAIALAEARPDIAQKLSSKLNDSGFVSGITDLAENLDDTAVIALADGQKVTAANCQEIVHGEVSRAINRGDIAAESSTVERQYVMSEWEQAISTLRTNPDELDGLLDWRVRKAIHDRINQKKDLPLDKRQTIDVGLDDIERANRYAEAFQKKLKTVGWDRLAKVFDIDVETIKSQVEEHKVLPFPGRSGVRGAKVKELKNTAGIDTSTIGIDWEFCRHPEGTDVWIDALAS